MTRSPVPALLAEVLTDVPMSTTDIQQAVAMLGHNVTRDTIAAHLRGNAVRCGKTGSGEHLWVKSHDFG